MASQAVPNIVFLGLRRFTGSQFLSILLIMAEVLKSDFPSHRRTSITDSCQDGIDRET